MKIAILTMDHREDSRDQHLPSPCFDAVPQALMEGFAALPELEVHVIACAQKPLPAPEKIAGNVWFHNLYVPKMGWARSSYQGCIRAVRRCLKMIQPDIVHGWGTERECGVCAAFSRFPNVLTSQGNMGELARSSKAPMGSAEWLAAQLEDIALQRTAGVICSTELAEYLIKPRAKKTWRIPYDTSARLKEDERSGTLSDLVRRHLEIYREVLNKDS